ncbi:MAG: right-handed parallel beta-helix repeat-containing protein [Candidatus Electryonea clarkiae]|nr:right-handed parallel beta-helix repeat-containing protein [Candidatus Electryonea clarkiae]MDP8286200.1 right-handed parallel beta-helix repeat-containing protein [Candidatus Electryonea clarkiae]
MIRHKLILAAIILISCLSSEILGQVHISGLLNGTLIDTTYIVEDDIGVAFGNTLIIEPGAVFRFDGDYGFAVNGRLYAVGTEEDSIFFVPNNGVEEWETISFNAQPQDSSRLEYCYFSGASSSAVNANQNTLLIINECTLTGNSSSYGGGINCASSHPRISNCQITGNTATTSGGGIYCSDSNPLISNCVVSGNSGVRWGGGVNFYSNSEGLLINCTIENNESTSTGGGINCSASSPSIISCTIEGNEATNYGGGIYCYNRSEPVMDHCLVIDNTTGISGAGIYSSSSSPEISFCTISENDAEEGWGSGVHFYNQSSPTLSNSIIANNTGIYGLYVNVAEAWITYCDFYNNDENGDFGGLPPNWLGRMIMVNGAGDSCDVNLNILENPVFRGGARQQAYFLRTNSPCIDTGDPDADDDPDETIADMGAYYYDHAHGGGLPPTPSLVEVNGICSLQYQDHHEGTNVVFIPRSPLAQRDSIVTDENGEFEMELRLGIYDILFTHDAFLDSMLSTVALLGETDVDSVTLHHVGISGSLSGTMQAGTYLIDGDITVLMEDTLIIEPGVDFLFNGAYGFDVQGYLHAVATIDDSIRFFPTPEADGWGGIRFGSTSSDESILEYCLVSGANQAGGIHCNQASPTFRHCTVSGNYATYWDGGGITCTDQSDPEITFCVINGNSASTTGGGIAILNESEPFIVNCTIYGNIAEYGGGILCHSSNPVFKNNILIGNRGQGGARFMNSNDVIVEYCLFYDNGNSNFSGTTIPAGLDSMTTVNTYGDSCDIYTNLYIDPYLWDAEENDFRLRRFSPCINGGDPDMDCDSDGTLPDIGAIPHRHTGPNLRVREMIHDFCLVEAENSVTWSIPLINTGYEDLVIFDLSSNHQAFVTQQIDTLVLEPGGRDSVLVTFTPVNNNNYGGIVTIICNDPVSRVVEVGVRGEGWGMGVSRGTEQLIPEEFDITSTFPNPFNSSINITIGLPAPAHLKVEVYNLIGKSVKTLHNSQIQPGYHDFVFDATFLAGGVYFVYAKYNDNVKKVNKIVLLK